MLPSRSTFLSAYVAAVVAAGALTLGVLLSNDSIDVASEHAPSLAVLAACVLLAELRPVRILPQHDSSATTSTTFAFALLLAAGPVPAAVTLAVASFAADTLYRRGVVKSLFNCAQYVLAICAAGGVGLALTGNAVLLPDSTVAQTDIVPLVASAATFFVINNVLVSIVVAAAEGVSMVPHLRREFAFQAGTDGALLAMSPVVVVVAYENLALIPFLLLPAAAVYMTARMSQEKQHQALHDALTGLPNRRLFLESAAERIAESPRSLAAVMLIDLDRFKEVNDTLGHHVGDVLLQEVGQRLQATVRHDDLVARLGGDEFAIFLGNLDSADMAEEIAGRITEAFHAPFEALEMRLHVEGSIGIAFFPEHANDVETLLQRADVAMYLAKADTGSYQVYSRARDPHSGRRLSLLAELRDGIAAGELELYYQPKVDLTTGKVTAVEALVRWQHPELGLLPPSEFVPMAESSGVITMMTEWVLNAAITQVAQWRAIGIDLSVAVNLSVRNLHSLELPEVVGGLLRAADVSAGALTLEVTESVVMADPVRALRVLSPLAEMGVRLSVDDFGTGHSSMSYLRQLPIHEIKIDRSFVTALTERENDAIIVRSTVELGHNLGLAVVAEGVEELRTGEMLATFGCDYAQGYFFAAPVPARAIPDVIGNAERSWAGRPTHRPEPKTNVVPHPAIGRAGLGPC